VTKLKSSRYSNDLETLFGAGALGRLSDAELLARFAVRSEAAGSEAAFSELLARHGPMVMGVCNRIAGDAHDAADAFQAVFLVLARKASAVRVGDSLGRWLYGVSVKVATRARRTALAGRRREQSLDGFDRAGGALPSEACERGEVRAVIDEEIARLPSHYRAAVVTCYLEGLTQEQAARRLCCPIGTVESRLHRARERLRSRLSGRGLAPAVGVWAWLSGETARANVSPGLLAKTTAAAVVGSVGGVCGSAVSSAVTSLVNETIRSMMMTNVWRMGLLLLAVGVPTAGAVTLSRPDDKDKDAKASAEGRTGPAVAPRAEPSLADRFAKLRAEYNAKQDAVSLAVEKAKDQSEAMKIYETMSPDEVAYTRRMIDLAVSAPGDPVARDALIWVISKPNMGDYGPYGAEFGRAASLLVKYHGDDPDAVCIGFGLENVLSFHRDELLLGFFAAAKKRESKGLARLALAEYLDRKAQAVAGPRPDLTIRPKVRSTGHIDEHGKTYDKEIEMDDEIYAYCLHLRQCDPTFLRSEAERLYNEVIAEYGDVRYRTEQTRRMEALVAQPNPTWGGKPLSDHDRQRLKDLVARKLTLAEVARGRLDEMQNLIEGKPAPEIDGVDFDGKPLKLSDYRGKVVVLVFWGTWCGPCMREVPHERELTERLKGKPFTVLGVNCDEDKGAAVKAIKSERITWPNWHDGAPGEGPITKRYHIRGYPTLFVIDGQGIIRYKQMASEGLDKAVDGLLEDMKPAAGGG
jgi:RNA polymerase sigma factor (sigma-70 family)